MSAIRMSREEARQQATRLVEQMSLDEKIGQLEYDAQSIERLNVPEYNYWNEALHGVARAGTATVFPQSIGLAAMFDPEMQQKIGDVVSTEARAKHNEYARHGDRDIYKGLTFWSPNVNIFRDPRWGRGHETYGEDPYLTATTGVAYIKGLQGDEKYLKLAACAKHFAVHSGPEGIRHGFNVDPTPKDLAETYLPAFKAAVQQGHVESVMAAYNAVDGVPAPLNTTLLQKTLREEWHFEGHVVSDYGAEEDVKLYHHFTKSDAETIALAIKAGCDLCAGHLVQYLRQALAENLITETAIDGAVTRLLTTRVLLGLGATDDKYDQIPFEDNDSATNHELALQATYKSFVLLKNNGILPLKSADLKSIAVIGPTADSTVVLQGNYAGTASNNVTILAGIRQAATKSQIRVNYSEGCHLFKDRVEPLAKADDRESEAVIAAEHSDVVVLCLGLDSTIEGEQGDAGNAYAAGDKTDLRLPGRQQHLLEQLLALNKPVILLITAGSALTFNSEETNDNLAAIMDVWYPGALGGQAVADVLFGKMSPSGKLPITFYQTTEELPDFTDYAMKNRTYRYMPNEALYPFGYGLTYSSVELANAQVSDVDASLAHANVDVQITNTGKFDVEEVVQVYSQAVDCVDATPNPKLAGFKRVKLAVGETKQVTLPLTTYAFEVVNDAGEIYVPDGKFILTVGVGQGDRRTERLTGVKALQVEVNR
ncbi:glycoside hydrolase family 3 C-terminal domain-containing protein [Lapidilactobacillus mulanensis]|uniref:Glycoside hydrolase family 3 C-terminal domain-containing protein n=1 Tax=Lapidilactobacillus mulanensis TaxID=2485999 RepID=A0ABW4DQB7_9LACO|nr:glycoside hydrolase family 3 C-terminal domain-containing protein [Lapidilactobacillus mulanensis]